MPLTIVHGDITEQKCDAIVNAANTYLQAGGGVCGAIFARAGHHQLQQLCDQIGECPTGRAVVTDGLNLSRYIIHAVGPIWQGGDHDEEGLLRGAYVSSLKLADELDLASIAFPLISSGIYGYPKDEALEVAVRTIGDYLAGSDLDVRLVIFDDPSGYLRNKQSRFLRNYADLQVPQAQTYKEPDYKDLRMSGKAGQYAYSDNAISQSAPAVFGMVHSLRKESYAEEEMVFSAVSYPAELPQDLRQKEDSFAVALFKLIDEKEMLDPDVYRRANLDRRLFSKIRSDENYQPSRNTAIALTIALRLSFDQANELLEKAGYRIGHSSQSDIIIEYCLNNEIYNIHEVNELLFICGQKTLGSYE